MGRPTKHQFRYKNVGRTSKLTQEVVTKLEECSQLRSTVKEACFYANISTKTYYEWMKKYPELSDRLEELREKPFLKARQTIIKGLDDVPTAFRFLEKEKPEDYGEKMKVEFSQGSGLETPEEEQRIIAEMHKKLKEARERRSIEQAKKDGEIK